MVTLLEAVLQVHIFRNCRHTEDTSQISLLNRIQRQCSLYTCREHCWSHSVRGHGLEGHPSVLWTMARFYVESLFSAVWDFDLCTAWPVKKRGSSRMYMGVNALPAKSATLSRSFLWRTLIRSPFLKSRAWHMDKAALQPSHNLGRSGGSIPYFRKRASCHFCAPSSVPFIFDGCTLSHDPVFVTRH